MERELTLKNKDIERFLEALRREEKSLNTRLKYGRDIRKFVEYIADKNAEAESLRAGEAIKIFYDDILEYKQYLKNNYLISSANSMLAAMNSFFKFLKREDLRVRRFKIQRKIYQSEDRNLKRREYEILIREAKKQGKDRLYLIMQTMAATGIRISEVSFVSVEALHSGRMEIYSKGKAREIYFPKELKKSLTSYIKKNRIKTGAIFCTSSGKPVDRSNIYHEMKKLAESTSVNPKKVFPHNLRHLFAREFYKQEKNIVALADILGHSSLETTRIYTKTSAREHAKKIEKLKLAF